MICLNYPSSLCISAAAGCRLYVSILCEKDLECEPGPGQMVVDTTRDNVVTMELVSRSSGPVCAASISHYHTVYKLVTDTILPGQ